LLCGVIAQPEFYDFEDKKRYTASPPMLINLEEPVEEEDFRVAATEVPHQDEMQEIQQSKIIDGVPVK
jgi:hypothetical protein